MTLDTSKQNLLDDLILKAKKKGADAADAVFIHGDSLSVSWHGGKIETLERAEGMDLGLRVLIGKRQACCSTSDLNSSALDEIVERAVSMARVAPEDPYCGLAEEKDLAKHLQNLDLTDSFEPKAEELVDQAKIMESALLSVAGVTNSDSTHVGSSKNHVYLAASNGFAGGYSRTSHWLSASAVAGEGTSMVTDNDWHNKTHRVDLPTPEEVGRRAGEKTVKNLGARKMPTGKVPVVFDPDEAGSLLGCLAGAINGSEIARGTSFLKNAMNQKIFGDKIRIIDDPSRPRGLRSRLFDAEGLSVERRAIVENGVLQSWILDLRTARQLGLKSTGHAVRGSSSVPSPSVSNFYMETGECSPQELIKDIKNGFYVTQTMGMGINDTTGDYSLSARGFWIEDGKITFPVHEMTIASNLKEMFLNLTPANDLIFRYGIDAPTLRIEGMTVAGM
ncbi:MAG: TldD/PmbA family protein [Bdellovibrionales bacterium]